MNFRKFFYRDYFESLNLSKPITDDIKKENKPIIANNNYVLKNAKLTQADYSLLVHEVPGKQTIHLIQVTTTYPGLIMGTGYIHETLNEGEFKLGFYFDCTTGLPCIPGSTIKGILRSVFPQFKKKDPMKVPDQDQLSEEEKGKIDFIASVLGWENDPEKILHVHGLEQIIFEGVDLLNTKEKRVKQPDEIVYHSFYNRFAFYNAFISSGAGQNLDLIFETDTITPHGDNPLKNPIPLNFLKIRPGVTFTIPIVTRPIPELSLPEQDIQKLFKEIILLIGLGSKTNVGYGQFQ